MKTKILQWLAIALIIEIGLIHLVTAQHEFDEAAYLGFLFVINFLGTLVASYGIYRQRVWGWWLGFFIVVGAMAGYIWSRTLGLPGTEVEEWLFPSGVVATLMEVLFLMVMLRRPWKMADSVGGDALPSLLSHLVPTSIIFIMVLITGYSYHSVTSTPQATHAEMVSVEELSKTSSMSFEELEQQYGLRVTQVAISALDSIVDVRVKVIDPEKAHSLLDSHAALWVDQKSLVLAPHMHAHAKLKPGQIYVIFFPTQNRTVQAGSEVGLVFGYLHVEPVIAR